MEKDNVLFFDDPNINLIFEALRDDIEADDNQMLTEELLTEGRLSDKIRWSTCKASLRFLSDETIDDIIKARYSDGEERIKQSRKEKVKMVKTIADELPEHIKFNIIRGYDADKLDRSANKAGIAAGTMTLAGGTAFAIAMALHVANPICAAIAGGTLVAHGIATAISALKHRKARTLRRDQVAAVLLDKLNMTKTYTHNQDGTITFGGMMRKVNAMYMAKPGDAMLCEDNGFMLVETAPMQVQRVLAEEFVVKNIRQKILTEASLREIDPVEVLKFMGVKALRPYNGMPFNKFILANLIPSQNIDAILGETGDYKMLITACLGDDRIQSAFKELKREVKADEPNKNAILKLKNDIQSIVLEIAQRLAPQSQEIQESAEMLEESIGFLAATGAVALGGAAVIAITKAIGALARWIKNRKKDKKHEKEQKEAKKNGENYVTFDNSGSNITITISTEEEKQNHLKAADDPDLPIYRTGRKVTIDEYLKKLESVYNMIQQSGEGFYIELEDRDDMAITLYSPDEIRRTFFEYEFTQGINRYYQIGENDVGDIICINLQDADNLFIVDIEDMCYVHDIKDLKKFKLSGGGLDPKFAIGSIRPLKMKKITVYDPAMEKTIEMKI